MDNLLIDQLLRSAVDSAGFVDIPPDVTVSQVLIAVALAIAFFFYLDSNL